MNEEKGVIVYEAKDGQEIKLSFETIKKYLVQGRAEYVTDQELMYFMGVCKSRGLNPFIKDAYLIKYSEKEGAAIVTSVDYFRKRAKAQRDCKGWKKGIIVERNGQVVYSNGLMIEGDKLLGGWFKGQPEGWDEPFELEVNLKGYIKRKQDGSVTKFWAPDNQPSQIMKVAESQGLRTLWPDEFQQLYTPEELGEADMFAQTERKKGRTIEMDKSEKKENPTYEVKDFEELKGVTDKENPPPPPPGPEEEKQELASPKTDFRAEWVNLKAPGYSTYVFKNFAKIESAGNQWPDLYDEMKEKWAKMYKDPWPLVEKGPEKPQETPESPPDDTIKESEGTHPDIEQDELNPVNNPIDFRVRCKFFQNELGTDYFAEILKKRCGISDNTEAKSPEDRERVLRILSKELDEINEMAGRNT